jgi:hypothetical protein
VKGRSRSFCAVTGPTPPKPLDRQPLQERELLLDRNDEQAVGLATPLATCARNFVRALSRRAARDRKAVAGDPSRVPRRPPLAEVTGQLGTFPSLFTPPGRELVKPEFSWAAIRRS